jgi:hypothetical protein
MQLTSLSLFADYFQFYLWDPGMNPKAPEDYAPPDLERRLKSGPNVVAIVTARNMTVPVTVEITDAEPSLDIDAWDHVAEASLHLPTGRLQLQNAPAASLPTSKSRRAGIAYGHATAGWIRSTVPASTATIAITWCCGRHPTPKYVW